MRVGEIVRDVREIFSGDIHQIYAIVVAGGEYDFAGLICVGLAVGVARVHFEGAVLASSTLDCFVEPEIEGIVIGCAAIIF